MTIDKETVHKLAHLARLELTDSEVSGYQKDLADILDWVEKLEKVDTEDIEPLCNLNEEDSRLRKDAESNYFKNEEALMNAPQKEGNHFVVPKVLND